MGWAYTHCDNCQAPKSTPTDAEFIVGAWDCSECGREHHLELFERRLAVKALLNRIDRLEERADDRDMGEYL